MRIIYTIILTLASPLVVLYLIFKMHKEYCGRRLKERLGIFNLDADIWIHASSVGEVKAASLFVKQLIVGKPDKKIAISTITWTGFEEVHRQLGDGFPHFFFCLDLPFIWRRVLKKLNVKMLIILEQEIWPNLVHACAKAGIKVYLINARFSEKSLKHKFIFKPLFQDSYRKLKLIGAQSPDDCKNFAKNGVPKQKCVVTGNLKFDLDLSFETQTAVQKIKQDIDLKRQVWIAGSTHFGEDEIILKIHEKILQALPNALLILAPRHPERFDAVYKLIKQNHKFSCVRHSATILPGPHRNILLLDTLGILLTYYGVADVALVAGSLLKNLTGHNLLEPAVFGKPVVSGNHLNDFKHIRKLLLKNQALIQITSATDGAEIILELLTNKQKREELGQKAKEVIADNQGAVKRTLKLLPDA